MINDQLRFRATQKVSTEPSDSLERFLKEFIDDSTESSFFFLLSHRSECLADALKKFACDF
jgi:hypothetical protein